MIKLENAKVKIGAFGITLVGNIAGHLSEVETDTIISVSEKENGDFYLDKKGNTYLIEKNK